MTDMKYQRFGKYLILDHLVDGGMAKICRATYLGEQANKIVAIKMVQPQYSKNPSFVQMFEDELKVTFGLLHPNIAQVYDYGMVDNQLYSAMEYVDGANLKQFLDRLRKKKFVFPVEISTHIISQVSQALHYAHTFQDKLTGKPFNIIHRDISPHNIMLTYDGTVKLIDFGIAKADSNTEATQAGTIKGKLAYLAPEYLEGLELDHRYDQFAVGITLWEMLCSRKLFTAKNDLAILKQIQACKVPRPSSINPNVPKELDEIVLKALSKDRTQRFENMDKLNRALVKFLYSNYPDFNATDLSYFAKQLFKEEIVEDKKKFVEFGKIDLRPYISDLQKNEQAGKTTQDSHAPVPADEITLRHKTGKLELDLGTFDQKEDSMPNLDLDFTEGTAGGVRTKDSSAGTKSRTIRTKKSNAQTNSTTQRSLKKQTRNKNLNRRNKDTESKGRSMLPTVFVAGLMAFAIFKPQLVENLTGIKIPHFYEKERDIASSQDKAQKPVEQKDQSPIDVPKGELIITNLSPEMKVFLNGKEREFDGITTRIPLNESFSLSVTKVGYKKWTYQNDLYLTEDRPYVSLVVPELKKDSVGFLTSSQNFAPGSKIKFKVGSEMIEKTLPLNNERVPAGNYEGVIVNPLLGTERKIRFKVEENKRNFLK
ncbi:MAG: hypothetical protein CME66_06985 [Halobacteriovoraceae bacterium]|nr:hypothetical protein [Halobacteriovoraceae bacterium]